MTKNQAWLGPVLALVVPAIMAVGMFYTIQANQANLEARLGKDEQRYEARFDTLEERQREDEILFAREDSISNERLARIEAKLEVIEGYTMAISQRLDVRMVSDSSP